MDHLRQNNDAAFQPDLALSLQTERVCHTCRADTSAAKGQAHKPRATERHLDQFYTCERVAASLYQVFCRNLDPSRFQFVEPSAGKGAFFKLLPPGSTAYDIDPKGPGIIKADFLKIQLPTTSRIAVIGNPPFGKNSSMAVRFFNHAAPQVEVIAFILPRTFQKNSILRRLDPFFHLLHEEVVQDKAFWFEGRRKSVPTVFQIWEKRLEPREQQPMPIEHDDFDFTEPHLAHFAIQRVGQRAGEVQTTFKAESKSHYFIKPNVEGLEKVFSSLNLGEVAKRTAGMPSLAKNELVALYTAHKRYHGD